MIPTTIHDTEGEIHWIEQILSIQPAVYSCEGCGRGERYTVLSEGKMKSLCFEQVTDPLRTETGRWFLEEYENEPPEEEKPEIYGRIQLKIDPCPD